MKVKEILTVVHRYYRSTGKVPSSKDRSMMTVSKEGQRKIGSWRKILWMAGVIPERRRIEIPRLRFKKMNGRYVISGRSDRKLVKLGLVGNGRTRNGKRRRFSSNKILRAIQRIRFSEVPDIHEADQQESQPEGRL